MQDLRHHTVDELSLLVFNNEELYNLVGKSKLFETIADEYIYTIEQMIQLKDDIYLEGF